MTGDAERWQLPVWWWGPLRSDRSLFSLDGLVSQGVLDQHSAELLALIVGKGASTIVCALPSGAGKTTLLTALLPYVDEAREPYFVRGVYDPLARRDALHPRRQALLVNEISPHLPIYLWGASACRVFDLALNGAQLLATAHADSPESLIHQLMTYPTSATVAHLRAWDLVVFLDAWRDGAMIRRQICSIVSLSSEVNEGIAVDRLAWRSGRAADLGWEQSAVESLLMRLRLRRDPALEVPG